MFFKLQCKIYMYYRVWEYVLLGRDTFTTLLKSI